MRPLLLLLLGVGTAAAQAPTLSVSVDREQIQVGETVQVRVQVSSVRGAQVEGPKLDDWQIVGRFQSSSFDSRLRANTTTINLTLAPAKAGALTIGVFQVREGAMTVRSEPITVQVGPPQAGQPHAGQPQTGQPQTGQPQAGQPDAPADGPPDPDVFLRWEASRTETWLGAQILVTLHVYSNPQLRIADFRISDVNLDGFWKHDRKQKRLRRAGRVQVGDRLFVKEAVAQYTLFPIRAGELQLPPVKADMSLVRGGFLRRRQGSALQRTAEPLPILVKALPTANQPRDFSGPAVGKAKLSMAANRTRVDANESLQITVTTEVEGLLQNFPPVELGTVDGFRVFPPSTHENVTEQQGRLRGVRRQVWLLRATKPGRLTVPSVTLPYFDPLRGRYQRARSNDVDVVVTGTPDAQDTPEATPQAAVEGPALRSVRKDVDLSAGDGGQLPFWFTAVVALPPLLFIGWIARDRFLSKRDAGAGARAQRNAARVAQAQLDQAANAENGHSALAKALMTYLETRLGLTLNGLTRPQLRQALLGKGVPEDAVDAVESELENADFARFAPATDKGQALQAAIDRARALVRRIEEAV